LQVRVFLNHVGVTTIERLDQGHLYPLGEHRDKHVAVGAQTSDLLHRRRPLYLKSYLDSLFADYSEPLQRNNMKYKLTIYYVLGLPTTYHKPKRPKRPCLVAVGEGWMGGEGLRSKVFRTIVAKNSRENYFFIAANRADNSWVYRDRQ
jgi:hypothetical protein